MRTGDELGEREKVCFRMIAILTFVASSLAALKGARVLVEDLAPEIEESSPEECGGEAPI